MGDPFMYEHKGTFYIIGTTIQHQGFHCWKSKDMENWEFLGFAYSKPENHIGSIAFWAPEVKYYKEKFYMTYSCLDKNTDRLLMSLAVSDTPEGPFKDLYSPWFDFGFGSIDGHIFVDDDGKCYLYFSRNGYEPILDIGYGVNYGVELEADLSKPIGEPLLLTRADQDWEITMPHNRCNEGPSVIKHNGKYYMTYSANDTVAPCYGIGYAVADKPLGPWIKPENGPILKSNYEIGVSAPGHNSILQRINKELYMVYHTHADPSRPSDNRVANIDRMYFTEDGKLRVDGPTRTPQQFFI